MIIKWHRVDDNAAHLYTDKDQRDGALYRQNNVRMGVYVGEGNVFVLLELINGSWMLRRSESETVVFDCATDDLDAAVTKINLLFETR